MTSLARLTAVLSLSFSLSLALGANTIQSVSAKAQKTTNVDADAEIEMLKNATNKKFGRSGNWKSNAQGAPDLEACRKAVQQKPNDAIAHNDLGWALRQDRKSVV